MGGSNRKYLAFTHNVQTKGSGVCAPCPKTKHFPILTNLTQSTNILLHESLLPIFLPFLFKLTSCVAHKLFLALLAPLHTHNHMGLVIKLITIHPYGTKILSRQMDKDANKNMVKHRK